ncbi:sigma-54 interaction domain-containing protein [Paludibaculum fermentans]|uniref:Sigma-54-dependent Fis family transcriptional regulator n=1 Tax=Paludibaculum fermentans TaxID=1473598 RepID=A0A7S7SN33_PALFE|nr:sigma-54 dependent transcriptional regulator [Paludibaculum fermentans]QOY91029.1 sigma-54-dependent Fis family transcriptional regulator [Paludibaculum fermentans]
MDAVFASQEMLALMDRVRRFALTDASVLICGESGTGKEIVARALCHYSNRSNLVWVDVSCGALPDTLMESELFGFHKGAFSGADQAKEGLFEIADGGTLFLDEIGELDLRLQVKLLRVLDSGEYYRLGGTKKVKVNVRILTATNQDLAKMVAEGRFRKDLYHRLAQLRLTVPPLRSRPEDVGALLEFFRQRHCPDAMFSPAALHAIHHWDWPGNVRELRNAIISAGAVATGGQVTFDDLPDEIRAAGSRLILDHSLRNLSAAVSGPDPDADQGGGLLEAMERSLILKTLTETNWHQEKAASILGISSRTLSRKLKVYMPSA